MALPLHAMPPKTPMRKEQMSTQASPPPLPAMSGKKAIVATKMSVFKPARIKKPR